MPCSFPILTPMVCELGFYIWLRREAAGVPGLPKTPSLGLKLPELVWGDCRTC